MTQKLRCQSFPIEALLHDDCDLQHREAFEAHLEVCETCRTRLDDLAADGDWWTKASDHLSTIDETELPQSIQSRLIESSSFVVPTLAGAATSNRAQHSQARGTSVTDWTQILDPPTHPEMLGRIDEFEIESKIGQGGMGIVLKGYDRGLNRAVAIKVLAPHLASNGTSRQRFAREAQAAAAVVHPHVIPIYSVKQSETRPYIVMQLMPGHSLQSLVRENGPLDVKQIVRIIIQIADGLAMAHKLGLIHRDIKPANILIERDVSRVVITDFGLARAADDAGLTQTGWIAGTPHYMSPEQSKGSELDARSDLFSLGALMYFLATGREPFRGEKPLAVIQKIISEQPTSPLELNSELPPMVCDVIEKLLEKNPNDRFESAQELKSVLERYLSHLQQPARVAKPARLSTRRRRKFRQRIGLAIFAVVAALAIGMFAFSAMSPRMTQSGSPIPQFPQIQSVESDSTLGGIALVINQSERLISRPTDDQNAETTVVDPNGFSFFSDDELLREINELNRDLDELQQSLQHTNPLESKQ